MAISLSSPSMTNYNSNVLNSKTKNKSKSTALNSVPKQNSKLDMLMEQKENLVKSKNSIIEDNLKNNGDQSSIKDRLDAIDKQIAEIDKQISRTKAEEQKISNKKDDSNKAKKNTTNRSSKPESKEAISEDNMNNLLTMASNISTTRTILAHKNSAENRIKIIEGDIKFDASLSLPSDPSRKLAAIDDLESSIERLDGEFNNKLKEVNGSEKSLNDNVKKNISTINENTSNDTEKEDTAIEFSDDNTNITTSKKAHTTSKEVKAYLKAKDGNNSNIETNFLAYI